MDQRLDLLEEVFDILRDHVFILVEEADGDFRLLDANLSMCEFFRQPRKAMIGQPLTQLAPPDVAHTIAQRYRTVLRSGTSMRYEETSEGIPGCDFAVFETALYPLRNQGEDRTLICGISRNITLRRRAENELRRMNAEMQLRLADIEHLQQQLREQALRDPLTGLFNRRYLEESLPRELVRARRKNEPVSLLMLDVDHFKPFNDTHGHSAGDAALKALAHHLGTHMRSDDILCRYGGEEFIAVMPGMRAEQVLQRLQDERNANGPFTVRIAADHTLPVLFSAGLAEFPRHGTHADTLFERADQALYRAKAEGRDCIRIFGESSDNGT